MTDTKPIGPWTDTENAALVSLYFRMLDGIERTPRLCKASLIRIAQGNPKPSDRTTSVDDFAGQLAARSRGSIEAKLMNASACHRDLDPNAETMATHGYKAWGNYQATLKTAMQAELTRRAESKLEAWPQTWGDVS